MKFLEFGAVVTYKTRWSNYDSITKCFIDRKSFDKWLDARRFKIIGIFTYKALMHIECHLTNELLSEIAKIEAFHAVGDTMKKLVTISDVKTNDSDIWIECNRLGEQFTMLIRDNTLTKWNTSTRTQMPIFACKEIDKLLN
jgi:hypothetical protein